MCVVCIGLLSLKKTGTMMTMMHAFQVSVLLLLTAQTRAFAPAVVKRCSGFGLKATQVDDKTEVREYFNTEGFNRWNKIYSESDDINTVQLDIRNGHDQTIQKILNWIKADGDIAGKTVCDCGCGVGSLAIPLAQMGAKISASDISDSMANEASRRASSLGIKDATFYTSDLESVTGRYDTVTCVDVAIHYPEDKMVQMVNHLCNLAESRVLISFAPKTWYYELLKKVGELFPGPSKTTRAYLHDEEVVRNALANAGFQVTRDEMTGTNFYFSRLLEAKRI
jgi:magnesium-protoporphyrin O-methyltransferase